MVFEPSDIQQLSKGNGQAGHGDYRESLLLEFSKYKYKGSI